MLRIVLLLCSLLATQLTLADHHTNNDDAIQWTRKHIKLFFKKADTDQTKSYFSNKTWNEAKAIHQNLTLKKIEHVELEQRAILDKAVLWRLHVHIKAMEKNHKKPAQITLTVHALRTAEDVFKITHIDRLESKPAKTNKKKK